MMRPVILALLAAFAGAAHAHEYEAGNIVIDHPVIPETTPVARSAGGYMTITNNGDAADTLVAVEADFPRVQIHETVESDGVARMEARPDGIAIAPGETVTLERGGLHVMMMGLAAPLADGDEVAATLVFEKAGRVDVVFNVEAAQAGSGDGMDHGDMDHGNMDMGADAPSN